MAKAQYRSEMTIMHEMLSVVACDGISGTKVSRISTKANLSHYATTDRCQKLVDAGLLELKMIKRNKIYFLTERGILFFQELRKFYDRVNSLNLKC